MVEDTFPASDPPANSGLAGTGEDKKQSQKPLTDQSELPIHKDGEGQPETHYTRIYRIRRRWVDNGCMDAIFAGSVSRLHKGARPEPSRWPIASICCRTSVRRSSSS
jgi:hypothetical protein